MLPAERCLAVWRTFLPDRPLKSGMQLRSGAVCALFHRAHFCLTSGVISRSFPARTCKRFKHHSIKYILLHDACAACSNAASAVRSLHMNKCMSERVEWYTDTRTHHEVVANRVSVNNNNNNTDVSRKTLWCLLWCEANEREGKRPKKYNTVAWHDQQHEKVGEKCKIKFFLLSWDGWISRWLWAAE